MLRLRLVSPAFVSKRITKKTGCSVVVMIVVIEPGLAAVLQLISRGHRHRHLCARPCRCCCGGDCGAATAAPAAPAAAAAAAAAAVAVAVAAAAVLLLVSWCGAGPAPVGESRCYLTMSEFKI